MNMIDEFKHELSTFIKDSGVKPTVIGREALGDPTFVEEVLENNRCPRMDTAQRVRDWMRAKAAELANQAR